MVRKFILVKVGKDCEHFWLEILNFLHIRASALVMRQPIALARASANDPTGVPSGH